MSSKEFLNFVKLFDKFFSGKGFVRKKLAFHKNSEWYYFIIDWQLSATKLAVGDRFTVNFGIFSLELASARNEVFRPRDIWSCHLQDRLGHLLPSKDDKWYTLEAGGEEALFAELKFDMCNYLFDYLDKFTDRDALYNVWLSGVSPGQTDLMRSEYIHHIERYRNK